MDWLIQTEFPLTHDKLSLHLFWYLAFMYIFGRADSNPSRVPDLLPGDAKVHVVQSFIFTLPILCAIDF